MKYHRKNDCPKMPTIQPLLSQCHSSFKSCFQRRTPDSAQTSKTSSDEAAPDRIEQKVYYLRQMHADPFDTDPDSYRLHGDTVSSQRKILDALILIKPRYVFSEGYVDHVNLQNLYDACKSDVHRFFKKYKAGATIKSGNAHLLYQIGADKLYHFLNRGTTELLATKTKKTYDATLKTAHHGLLLRDEEEKLAKLQTQFTHERLDIESETAALNQARLRLAERSKSYVTRTKRSPAIAQAYGYDDPEAAEILRHSREIDTRHSQLSTRKLKQFDLASSLDAESERHNELAQQHNIRAQYDLITKPEDECVLRVSAFLASKPGADVAIVMGALHEIPERLKATASNIAVLEFDSTRYPRKVDYLKMTAS